MAANDRYFARGTIADHLKFATRTVVQRTPLGARQSVGLKDDNPFLVHVNKPNQTKPNQTNKAKQCKAKQTD
jgi:hypothetical protein